MAHEEDSSSQRDNLHIFRLDNLKNNKIRIVFSDNSTLDVVQDIIIQESVYQGKEISKEDYDRIKHLSEQCEAEKYALNLLSYRQHSKKSLHMKLIKRGFTDNSIELLLIRLEDLNYLNDREFAKAWVASRILRHPEGKNALLAGLLKQGIDRVTGKAVIDELISDEKEIELAEEVYNKLTALGKPDTKMVSALLSRGFPYSVIRKVMEVDSD